MMKTTVLVVSALALAVAVAGTTRPEVLNALERLGWYISCDNLEAGDVPPSPLEVKGKFGLSDAELLQAILDLAVKYDVSDTNEDNRLCREASISWLGKFGNTNNLPFLNTIMTNSSDYAQQSAVGASMTILEHSPDLIPLARSIVTNATAYSTGIRGWTYSILLGMCSEGKSDNYINDPAQHSRIAAFFLERAALENDDSLFIDRCACTLNPSYRHSQQRRDNLAALRPPNLTGKPAELYDVRQADAAKED